MSRPRPNPGELPEKLKDPCNDRPVKTHAAPPAQLLTTDALYDKKGNPNLNVLMTHLAGEGVLCAELLTDLINRATKIFTEEPNLLKLNDPITVVGDIHGQYFDLAKLFEVGGDPCDTQYIFLGDYVDRGSFSIEVVATMYAIKIIYSKRFKMLRGNHECRQMTSFFNFREECEYKYDINIYNLIMDSFDTLPLAATVNGKFLCVHGGISPDLPNLKALTSIDRFMEPPREGLLCDLIWSDPAADKDEKPKEKKKKQPSFIPNEVRGCSYFYSHEGANKFLEKNTLLSIIRAHEAQLEGYKMHKTNPTTGFPSVITIFSAPNYCDCYNNKAAILKFDNSTLNILQFNCSPHPYHLPNFMDVFTWSIPFVIEKVTEMLYYILQPSAGRHIDDDEPIDLPESLKTICRSSLSESQNSAVQLAANLADHIAKGEGYVAPSGQGEEDARDRMRKKVRSIAKMARMFKTLRQENETVIRLGGMCPGDKLNAGLLLTSKEGHKDESEMFSAVALIDKENEALPQDATAAIHHEAREFADED